jgi:hypothetical protein
LEVEFLIVLIVFSLPTLAADDAQNQPRTEISLLEFEQNWAALAGQETLVGEASR